MVSRMMRWFPGWVRVEAEGDEPVCNGEQEVFPHRREGGVLICRKYPKK